MRSAPFACALLLGACTTDALYTVCDHPSECGERTVRDGDVEYDVPLECIEATVMVAPDRTTVGSFCTLLCARDADCDSRIGLPDGRCIRLAGDDEAFCYQRCDDGAACYPSSACETIVVDGADVRVCLPTVTP